MKISNSFVFLPVVFLILTGCIGRVPGEVVELSTTVGEDLKALHRSYRALVTTHFDSLRAQTDSFIRDRWLPVFIDDFMKRGNLVQAVQTALPGQAGLRVSEWVSVAMETVMEKRSQLMKPIDDEEVKLLEMVDNSFGLLTRANAKISSHLSSRSKGKNLLEEALNMDDLKGLREKISGGLAAASRMAAGNLEKEGPGPAVKSKGETDQ